MTPQFEGPCDDHPAIERVLVGYRHNVAEHDAETERAAKEEIRRLRALATTPIPMLLYCPRCNGRHIDEGIFATKPHETHSCQHCGLTWKPAKVPTVGVEFLPGYRNDEPPLDEAETFRQIAARNPHLLGR